MRKLIIVCIFLSSLLFSGCFFFEQKTAVLSTNIPEVAAYVEIFNASQDTYRIVLEYSDNPSDIQHLTAEGAPDIVISKNLSSNAVITAFTPLNKSIEKAAFDTSGFYPDLLKLGRRDTIQYVLPVSFNIPAIMYKQGTLGPDFTDITISPEQLKEEALLFNERDTPKFRVKGFSPSWNHDFLLYNAFIFGADFAETTGSSLVWNEENLQSSTAYCREWTETVNSGYKEIEDFTLTYCYDPGYKLLNAGRTGFYYTTMRDFFKIPAADRSTLELKWLGSDSAIPVCEDIVFTGIPNKSTGKKAAAAFIFWFLSENTQKMLLESSQFKRTRGFGFCEGLSSLHNVNELVLPEYYRSLIGEVPPVNYLDFPESLPAEWEKIRSSVIIPWLKEKTSENPDAGDLSGILQTWVKQEKNE
jgi:ABC-type glycerol-3-phosphate transport system substrate-binding protein